MTSFFKKIIFVGLLFVAMPLSGYSLTEMIQKIRAIKVKHNPKTIIGINLLGSALLAAEMKFLEKKPLTVKECKALLSEIKKEPSKHRTVAITLAILALFNAKFIAYDGACLLNTKRDMAQNKGLHDLNRQIVMLKKQNEVTENATKINLERIKELEAQLKKAQEYNFAQFLELENAE